MSAAFKFQVNGEGEQEVSFVYVIQGNTCMHCFTVQKATREIVVKDSPDGTGKECLVDGKIIAQGASRVTFVDNKGSAFFYPEAVRLTKIPVNKKDFVACWNKPASEAKLKSGDLITIDPDEDSQWVKDYYFEVVEITDNYFVVCNATNLDSAQIAFPLTRIVSKVSRNSIAARMLGLYKPTAEELVEEMELVADFLIEINSR